MYLFFDVETTGLPLNWQAPVSSYNMWPRIVQIAFIRCGKNGKILESYNYLVRPDNYTIPDEAIAIHGITNERALSEGLNRTLVLDLFLHTLKKSKFMIAHNVDFDYRVVASEFYRCSNSNPMETKVKFCTMKDLRVMEFVGIEGYRGKYKWPKLNELHNKIFGCDFEGAHNALNDVTATADCFFELKKRGIVKI